MVKNGNPPAKYILQIIYCNVILVKKLKIPITFFYCALKCMIFHPQKLD